MLRWLTAGESHGPELTAIIEGLPAGIPVSVQDIGAELQRRRWGHGRGSRMRFEADTVHITSGVRHGVSTGGPVTIRIENTEWPKWQDVMSVVPLDADTEQRIRDSGRGAPLTRPRPGHADLVGMQKYGFDDARNVLERASARETAARVALGAIAKSMLAELGITVFSHTVAVGNVQVSPVAVRPSSADQPRIDADPVRCADPVAAAEMVQLIDRVHSEGDTLGGTVEVIAEGVMPGLGSYAHWDRRLDGRIAGALMSVPAIKAVAIGDGAASASKFGSHAHDQIIPTAEGITRQTEHSGGIEGGVSTGAAIRARMSMKPISTVPNALRTVDVSDGSATVAHHQRSDVTAVPAAGVIGEAMLALVIAEAVLEKFGSDSMTELQRNVDAYMKAIPATMKITSTVPRDSATPDATNS